MVLTPVLVHAGQNLQPPPAILVQGVLAVTHARQGMLPLLLLQHTEITINTLLALPAILKVLVSPLTLAVLLALLMVIALVVMNAAP